MTADILTLARETLALADGAADGPWGASYDPEDGEVWDDNGKLVCRVGKHPIGANCAFIAHSRTAAPELARFVERVDEVTAEMWMEAATEQAYESDDESEAMCVLSDLRRLLGLPPLIDAAGRRLGLDTTEGGR